MILIVYLILFISVPLSFAYSGVGIIKSPSNYKKYIPFFILSIAIIAYSYTPINNPDLSRYFEMLEVCKNLTLSQVFAWFDDGLFIKNFIFWFIGHLGVPHLLPAISVSTVYGISAYITCDTAKTYNATKYIPLILLCQIMILPYLSVVNNVRNIWAFSLVVLAAYFDTVKKKRKIWVLVLYIVPCFIHNAAIMIIVFRLMSIVAKKFKLFTILSVFFLPMIINFVFDIRSFLSFGGSVGKLVNSVIVKAYEYLNETDSEWAISVMQSTYQQVNRLTMMLIAIFIIVLILYQSKNDSLQYETYYTLVFLICVMTIACNSFVLPHYWRFSSATIIAVAPIIVPILKKGRCLPQYVKFSLLCLFSLTFIALLLQVWYGQYLVDYVDWGIDMLFNNIFTIMYDIFKGIFMF